MGPEHKQSLSRFFCLSQSHKAVIGICQVCVFIWRLDWGRICFQAHSLGCCQDSVPWRFLDGGPQFLMDCCLEPFLISLPDGPLHRAANNMAACFLQNKGSMRECNVNKEPQRIRNKLIDAHALVCLYMWRKRLLGEREVEESSGATDGHEKRALK